MSDVQADINESQAVQAALAAAAQAQGAVASLATQTAPTVDATISIATESPAPVDAVAGNGEPLVPNEATIVDRVTDATTASAPQVPVTEPSTLNTGAALAEQAAAFKAKPVDGQTLTSGVQVQTNHVELSKAQLPSALGNGTKQAGNAMDTMHGKVNKTWPPSTR